MATAYFSDSLQQLVYKTALALDPQAKPFEQIQPLTYRIANALGTNASPFDSLQTLQYKIAAHYAADARFSDQFQPLLYKTASGKGDPAGFYQHIHDLYYSIASSSPIQQNTLIYDSLGNVLFEVAGSIPAYQFQSNTSIYRVVTGASTISIGANAFDGCSSLAVADISLSQSVSAFTFTGCVLLNDISSTNIQSVGDGAFFNCDSITSISFPNCTLFGQDAFFSCNLLASAKLNCPLSGVGLSCFANTSLANIHLRPSPNTPSGWTLGSGQTVGGKTGVTVSDDWTTYPN